MSIARPTRAWNGSWRSCEIHKLFRPEHVPAGGSAHVPTRAGAHAPRPTRSLDRQAAAALVGLLDVGGRQPAGLAAQRADLTRQSDPARQRAGVVVCRRPGRRRAVVLTRLAVTAGCGPAIALDHDV